VDANLPAPWKHQLLAIDRSQRDRDLALFWEVGTGKSRATIDILRHRYAAHNRVLRTLILAPKIVLVNWQREILRYSRIHKWDIVILTGSGKKREQQLKDALMEDLEYKKNKIIITNYESLQMESVFTILKDWKPEAMVADEAHRLKNPESVRAKRTIALADLAEYRYALTGTPILNSAMDVFNIYRFLDRGATFGKNFWVFRSNYFEDVNAQWQGKPNYYPKFEPRPETYQKFHEMIYKKALRAIKSECLDLPPFVRKEVHVELSAEQAKLYKQMKEDYIAFIDDPANAEKPRAVVAQMAVTKAMRLQQIVTGYAKTDEGEIYNIKDNPRIDALTELLEDLAPHHKVIVWSIYHENYSDIRKVCEALKLDYTELHGQINSQKVRQANIDRFNTDPKCRVLIANQAAGGIGINLVSSSVGIWYSKSYRREDDVQSEGRNYRGGSKEAGHECVTRIDIVATGTIDEIITQALLNKEDIANKVLDRNWGTAL
jgi:SNF2 family DNA or RNA helicase